LKTQCEEINEDKAVRVKFWPYSGAFAAKEEDKVLQDEVHRGCIERRGHGECTNLHLEPQGVKGIVVHENSTNVSDT